MDIRVRNIDIVSFIAAVSIVVWHCANGSRLSAFVVPTCFWAVSWFMLISGAFAIRSLQGNCAASIIKKKLSTLFLPYLYWSLFGLLVALVTMRCLSLDVNAIFALTGPAPIFNSPLWFLRSLIVFFIVLIVIKLILPPPCWVLAFLVCVGLLRHLGVAIGYNNSCSVWFAIGMILSKYIIEWPWRNMKRSKFVSIVVGMLLACILLRSLWVVHPSGLINNFSAAFQIASILMIANTEEFKRLHRIGLWALSMPIYVMHFPIVQALRHFLGAVTEGGYGFLLLIALALAITLGMALSLRRWLPRLYYHCMGARG